jgi:lipopolysaccharide transport system ATP-binding protein
MQEISRSGRTVLFVSHNMGAIRSICERSLVLDAGQVSFQGDIAAGIARYEEQLAALGGGDLPDCSGRRGTGASRFTSITLMDASGRPTSMIPMGQEAFICLRAQCSRTIRRPKFGVTIETTAGQRLFRLLSSDQGVHFAELDGSLTITCRLPSMPLLPGKYMLSAGMSEGVHSVLDAVDGVLSFEVIPADVFGTGQIPQGNGDLIFVPSEWRVSPDDSTEPRTDSVLAL